MGISREGFDMAMRYLGRMFDQGMRLDVKGYGVVVLGLCSNGELEKALDIRRETEYKICH